MKSYRFFGAIILMYLPVGSKAQKWTVQDDSLFSQVLHEKRNIRVYLPQNFNASDRYDILYLLDGEDFGDYASQIISVEREFEYAPPLIIVSILNRDLEAVKTSSRNRDFLPVYNESFPVSGGSANFLSFIKNELMSHINSKFPLHGRNILFGQSFGGLFTLFTLFTRPETFDSYIASDPGIWYNKGYINKLALQNARKLNNLNRTLFIAGREGQLFHAIGIYSLDSILKINAVPGFKYKCVAYINELHSTIKVKAIYDGLRFTYFGYQPSTPAPFGISGLDIFPMNGILLKDKPVHITTSTTFLDYAPGVRYTTDGTEPTPASPKFEYGIQVSAPAQITLKLFSTTTPDITIKGNFILGRSLPPVPKPASAKPGGLYYALYKSGLNDIARSKPVRSGIAGYSFTDGFIFPDSTNFTCALDGFIEIQKEGYYTFYMVTDNQAQLFINDRLLINVNVPAEKLGAKSFIVPLEKGFHPVKLLYAHTSGIPNLKLYYLPPEAQNQELFSPSVSIPSRMLYNAQ